MWVLGIKRRPLALAASVSTLLAILSGCKASTEGRPRELYAGSTRLALALLLAALEEQAVV